MHSSLSLIHLVMAATWFGQRLAPRDRLTTLVLGGMSLAMVFLTATRTAFLTLAILALLDLATAQRPVAAARRLVTALPGFLAAFAGWTLLLDDSFWRRLIGGQGDFSSGRWSSIVHWLALAGDHPFGMGLGAVRELLADGRPALDGSLLLEWPHNEFVRLYVEAGPPGLLFVVLLLTVLVQRAIVAAREPADPVLRALVLVIAADLVAEACLQNLLNAVYHATVLILILCLAAAAVRQRRVAASAEPANSLAHPLLSP
jgi:O-antigen ligase